MKKIYKVNNSDFSDVGKRLDKGELIIYPTDTVYGLGAKINFDNSLEKIYQIKRRNLNSPLIVLISNTKFLQEIAIINEKNREKIKKLIEIFWPGELTIILDKKGDISNYIVNNDNSIGIRMPNLKVSLEILNMAGGMLATTSANISGKSPALHFSEIDEELKNGVDILIQPELDNFLSGTPSTIIDMRNTPKILRIGSISLEDIERVIGKI